MTTRDRDKKSRPLHPAVRSGNLEVVRLLLEHGAEPRVHHVRDALRPGTSNLHCYYCFEGWLLFAYSLLVGYYS